MTPPPSGTLRVALTGGIGSGKSAAAAHLERLGAAIVDTDLISHQITAPHGAAIAPIAAEFGERFLTAEGALARAAMRDEVFANPDARRRLEAILHPLIRQHAREACERAREACCVLVVPLLVETGGWREQVERVCVVDCPQEMQIARVIARNALPEAQVRAMLAAQASRAQRLAIADDVIDNSASLAALHQQVERLYANWRQQYGF